MKMFGVIGWELQAKKLCNVMDRARVYFSSIGMSNRVAGCSSPTLWIDSGDLSVCFSFPWSKLRKLH